MHNGGAYGDGTTESGARYSEVFPETKNILELYWKRLRQTPVIGGIGVLATINCLLSEHRSADRDVHRELQERIACYFLCRRLGLVISDRPFGPERLDSQVSYLAQTRESTPVILYSPECVDGVANADS